MKTICLSRQPRSTGSRATTAYLNLLRCFHQAAEATYEERILPVLARLTVDTKVGQHYVTTYLDLFDNYVENLLGLSTSAMGERQRDFFDSLVIDCGYGPNRPLCAGCRALQTLVERVAMILPGIFLQQYEDLEPSLHLRSLKVLVLALTELIEALTFQLASSRPTTQVVRLSDSEAAASLFRELSSITIDAVNIVREIAYERT
jgi:hypothetical protein